jgi:hypothetical protein
VLIFENQIVCFVLFLNFLKTSVLHFLRRLQSQGASLRVIMTCLLFLWISCESPLCFRKKAKNRTARLSLRAQTRLITVRVWLARLNLRAQTRLTAVRVWLARLNLRAPFELCPTLFWRLLSLLLLAVRILVLDRNPFRNQNEKHLIYFKIFNLFRI